MINRDHKMKGGLYCALPIGETDLDGNTVMTRMADLALALRVLLIPMNGQLMVEAKVNNDRCATREYFVERALEKDAKWIFWMDVDVLPPCDALAKLFARRADIVGGLIVSKSDTPQPLIINRGESYEFQEFTPGDLVPCDAMGLGCTLMKTEIFKKLEKPWFREGFEGVTFGDAYSCTEDVPLMYRAKDAGFDCYVDTSVVCKHVDWKTGTRYSWDTEKNAPLIELPNGKALTFFNAKQQLAYQMARDSKEEK